MLKIVKKSERKVIPATPGQYLFKPKTPRGKDGEWMLVRVSSKGEGHPLTATINRQTVAVADMDGEWVEGPKHLLARLEILGECLKGLISNAYEDNSMTKTDDMTTDDLKSICNSAGEFEQLSERECNLAAAQLLCLDYICEGDSIFVEGQLPPAFGPLGDAEPVTQKRKFDIWQNASDCLAVEEVLGNRGISICGTGQGTWFIWDELNQNHLLDNEFSDRTAALGAACAVVSRNLK